MKIQQSGEPVGEVLSLALAKQHCLIDHTDDDAILAHYIASAVEWVQDACQTIFLETEFTATGDDFALDFKGYPNPDIVSVSYIDKLGVPGAVSDAEIRESKLHLGQSLEASSATVVFKAGLGAGNIPAKLVHAAAMLTASFYQQRADFTADPANSVPMGVRAMVSHHRSFAFV